jgi:hypothetical protein
LPVQVGTDANFPTLVRHSHGQFGSSGLQFILPILFQHIGTLKRTNPFRGSDLQIELLVVERGSPIAAGGLSLGVLPAGVKSGPALFQLFGLDTNFGSNRKALRQHRFGGGPLG